MISFHLGAGNQSDLEALIALAAGIGVGLKISPIRPLGRAIDELPWSFIQPRDYLQVVETVSRMRMRHPQIDIVTDFDIIDGPHKHACQRDRGATACKAGRTMVNINYDGGIYPCAFFVTRDGTFCAGNVYQDSITEVWQHSPVFRPFRIHQKSGVCQSCGHYRNRCVGGCPAIAYFTTGCLDAHDPTCIAHYMAPPRRMEP